MGGGCLSPTHGKIIWDAASYIVFGNTNLDGEREKEREREMPKIYPIGEMAGLTGYGSEEFRQLPILVFTPY